MPESTVGLGSLNAISYLVDPPENPPIDLEQPLLSVSSLVAERDAWKDFVSALRELSAKRAQARALSHTPPPPP